MSNCNTCNSGEKFIEYWGSDEGFQKINLKNLETPCYIVSEDRLEYNLRILDKVQKKTGVKILMALKCFSMYSVFPLIKKYLAGTEVSSVNEARLGHEEYGKETHVFSPSYTDNNIKEYIKYGDHLVFNSFSQWNKFKKVIKSSKKKISCGIRVNPEHSEGKIPMYDPCVPRSHFGVTLANFEKENLDGIEGLHFHTLCNLNADALERTLKVFEEKFGSFLGKMKWVNFGGGHHITRFDYDVELLCKIISDFKKRHPHLIVYLEPGEAIALNVGVLATTVVDIFNNEVDIAVLDASAACHMPDVLEAPFLPKMTGAKPLNGDIKGEKNVYKLVGPTCLAGDVIGYYSFPEKLKVGQKLIFLNMAIYTMVKNNTFNGVNLPSIAVMNKKNKIKVIKKFGYKDFKGRLS